MPNYRDIRDYARQCHQKYGDDVTFIPGGYFANAYNSREQVNKDLHDALARVSEFMGGGFRPKSVVAGFLAAENLQYLAEKEDIHVCQGNIWSQYAIDNQDGDGTTDCRWPGACWIWMKACSRCAWPGGQFHDNHHHQCGIDATVQAK